MESASPRYICIPAAERWARDHSRAHYQIGNRWVHYWCECIQDCSTQKLEMDINKLHLMAREYDGLTVVDFLTKLGF